MKKALPWGIITMFLALAVPQGLPTAEAGGLDPTYNVSIYDTKDFNGVGGEWFWGTAFFYQAVNEGNDDYDWYFVGLKFHRQNPIGTISIWDAWMDVIDLNYQEVVGVDAQPWYKNPMSGDFDLGVSTGGSASVTVHLDSDGYDRGAWFTGSNWKEFGWRHTFTQADNWYWDMKSGAQVSKVIEASGYSNVNGAVYVYYEWFGWDWGCWCDLWRYRWAEFPHGNVVTFEDQTPGG